MPRIGSGPTEKETFIAAEAEQESGGRYDAVNSSSGALGKWQVMPANLPGWAHDCRLQAVSPSYYLSHPRYQDQLVWCILGGYYDTYGPRGAASMWYSGQSDWHATYGNPPVYQYVNDVIALMKDPNLPPYNNPGTVPPYNPSPNPNPGADDWSDKINHSAGQVFGTSVKLKGYADGLKVL